MSTSVWRLQLPLARFEQDGFTGTVDVTRPSRGLSQLRIGDDALCGAVLEAEPSPGIDDAVEPLIEAYVRGNDLVATYAQTPGRPFRHQIYWRAIVERKPLGFERELPAAAAVEWLASVQTGLLDSHPESTCTTRLVATEALRLADPERPDFLPLDLKIGEPHEVGRQDGPGCFLLRLPGERSSYAEMLPPSDYGGAVLTRGEDDAVLLRFGLFGHWLEKGVILRARRRGIFLERSGDADAAKAWYDALLASELPLTA